LSKPLQLDVSRLATKMPTLLATLSSITLHPLSTPKGTKIEPSLYDQRARLVGRAISHSEQAGEIFRPLQWTPKDAMRFLGDVETMERAGLVIRMPADEPAKSSYGRGDGRLDCALVSWRGGKRKLRMAEGDR
jgi:hypothetical protein